ARGDKLLNGDQATRSARRRSDDRESLRRAEAVKQVGSAPRDCRYLHVGDREADLFPLFEQTTLLDNVGFVIRVRHDRSALPGHDTPEIIDRQRIKGSRLKEWVGTAPPEPVGLELSIAAN